jgi:hypothetical protein
VQGEVAGIDNGSAGFFGRFMGSLLEWVSAGIFEASAG